MVTNPRIPKSVHRCKEKLCHASTPSRFHRFSNYSFIKGTRGRFGTIELLRFIFASPLPSSRRRKTVQIKKIRRDSHPLARVLKLEFEEEQNSKKTGGIGRAVGRHSRSKTYTMHCETAQNNQSCNFQVKFQMLRWHTLPVVLIMMH